MLTETKESIHVILLPSIDYPQNKKFTLKINISIILGLLIIMDYSLVHNSTNTLKLIVLLSKNVASTKK